MGFPPNYERIKAIEEGGDKPLILRQRGWDGSFLGVLDAIFGGYETRLEPIFEHQEL